VGFVSYDDERAICDTTEYVIDRNLNGYIIWEISGNLMPDLSTPLLDATNNKLNKSSVRCDPTVPNDQVVTLGPTRTPTPLPSMMEGQKPTLMPTSFTPKPTNITSSPTPNDAVTTIIPKDEDIIFGRGAKRRHNPGNIRLLELVDEYNRKYPCIDYWCLSQVILIWSFISLL
jgi:hypothetical protein